MGKLKCPRCRGAAIQIMPIAQNMKQKHSININPLHPLTFANTNVKPKKSLGKMALGMATGGASLLFTGVNKDTTKYHCTNCGHVWTGK